MNIDNGPDAPAARDLIAALNARSAAELAAELRAVEAGDGQDVRPVGHEPMDVDCRRPDGALQEPPPAQPARNAQAARHRDLELVQILEGHTDRVWAVAWSPDGNTLASCGGDKQVRIWHRFEGGGGSGASSRWACTATLEEGHQRTVRALSWSPDGKCLASASFDATTAIWERQAGVWEMVATLEGHENEVKDVAWSPSGTYVATCGRDRSVWIWESMPGHEYECVDVKQGHTQDVKALAWHPSGEVLVSASYDDSIRLWVDSGDEWECAQNLSGPGLGHSSTVWGVAFNASGTLMVSCSDDRTLRIWACLGSTSRPHWKLLAVVEGCHERTVFSVDWSAGGLIATGSGDNAIRVFQEPSTARPADAEANHSSGGASHAATGVRTSAANGSVNGVASAPAVELLTQRLPAHDGDVNCVRWHPLDSTLLASAGDDGTVRLWRLTE